MSPPKRTRNSSPGGRGEAGDIPLLIRIFVNLVAAAALYLYFPAAILPIPCSDPVVFKITRSAVLILLLYLTFEVILVVAPYIKVKENQLKTIAKAVLRLQPWRVAGARQLYLSSGLIVLALLFFWIDTELLYSPVEEMPVVEGLSVTLAGEPLKPVRTGDLVEVGPGEQALFQAQVRPGEAITCAWSKIAGSLQEQAGCAALYNAPIVRSRDALTLTVYSACKTRQAVVGIPVEIK